VGGIPECRFKRFASSSLSSGEFDLNVNGTETNTAFTATLTTDPVNTATIGRLSAKGSGGSRLHNPQTDAAQPKEATSPCSATNVQSPEATLDHLAQLQTHATQLAEVGESLRRAQSLLGHSDLETTLNVYMHAIPDAQRRAVDKVAEVLSQMFTRFQRLQKIKRSTD
jgi:hypothetical protein